MVQKTQRPFPVILNHFRPFNLQGFEVAEQFGLYVVGNH